MNVLEKILEELENRKSYHEELLYQRDDYEIQKMYCEEELDWVREIIRSHMVEQEVFKFDFNRVKSFDCQCGRHYVNTSSDGWIPCSGRLPEDGKEVLAQFVVRVVHTNNKVDEEVYIHPMHYENGIWESFAGVPNGKVEAWQPLPKPYKEE